MSDEYPKMIRVGGIEQRVESAADEARWCGPVHSVAVPEPAEPSEPDVVEQGEPKKKSKKK